MRKVVDEKSAYRYYRTMKMREAEKDGMETRLTRQATNVSQSQENSVQSKKETVEKELEEQLSDVCCCYMYIYLFVESSFICISYL